MSYLFSHLIHRSTFFLALLGSPTSTNYPSTALLHAICAVGSLHSPVIAQGPMPDLNGRPAYEVFVGGAQVIMEQGLASEQAGSFAVEQAALARAMATYDARTGVKLMDVVRTMVVLGWYYVSFIMFVATGPYVFDTDTSWAVFKYAVAQYVDWAAIDYLL